jgi:hypothetical protein
LNREYNSEPAATHNRGELPRISDLIDPGSFDKEQYIRLLYRVILQRDPDPVAFEKFCQRQDTHRFFTEFVSCPEFRGKAQNSWYMPGRNLGTSTRPRVLLFGAYGNGNLGDKIQVQSLLRAIRQIRPDVEVWACSVLHAAYPFPFHRTLPADAFNNPRILDGFDMLMIGGGGLLAHPHDPLTNAEWQKAVEVPVALIGVGATPDVAAHSEILIKKAAYVSVRDDHSMSSMQRFIGNASFVPDPVLCDAHYRPLTKISPPQKRSASRKLWILKYAARDQFAHCQRLIDPENDEICFLEPALDFPLLAQFPRAQPIYEAAELTRMIDKADLVISMRYHGCILAMLRNRPTIAVREHKCLDLFRRYGNERYFVHDVADISFDLSRYQAPAELLARDRGQFMSEMSNLLAILKSSNSGTSRPAALPPQKTAEVWAGHASGARL